MVSGNPMVNDLDILDFSKALYDRVKELGLSESDVKCVIKNMGKKPKPMTPKFKIEATKPEEVPEVSLANRIVRAYNSYTKSEIDAAFMMNGAYVKSVPPRMVRLIKAIHDQEPKYNDEARVLVMWNGAMIKYLMDGDLQPPIATSKTESKITKAIEKFVMEVITYEGGDDK